MKKAISSLLVITTILSILMFAPNSITAAEVDSEKVSASCVKTRDEAVAWLNAQEGARYNIDGSYGSQCSDFTSAYVNYVLTGDPYGGRIGVYNAKEYANAGLYPSDWQVIQNTASFVPEPGDIFVVTGADPTYGHTGVVISSDVNNATVADQNGLSDWSLDYGSPAHIHYISWSGSFTPRYFIRPCFKPKELPVSNAWVSVSKSRLAVGDSNTITFGANNANRYNIRVDKDGSLWKYQEGVSSGLSYTFSEAGNYSVFIAGHNSSSYQDSSKVYFTVFDCLNLGNDFIAKITHVNSGKRISAYNDNTVILQYKDTSDNQNWRFMRNTDGSYRITNVKLNQCLDVYDSQTSNEAKIVYWNPTDNNNQKWYIVHNKSGYGLVPKHCPWAALDVPGNKTDDGTAIQQYQWNESNAQNFTIDYVGLKPAATVESNAHKYEFYNNTCTWWQAYRTCEKLGGHLVSITSRSENDKMLELTKNYTGSVWIGATRYESSNWYWVNSEPYKENNLWAAGEPNNTDGKEESAHLYISGENKGKWNDVSGNRSIVEGFICEYDDIVNESIYIPVQTAVINGYTYDLYDYSVDWQTAKKICEKKGGVLASITSSSEYEEAWNLIKKGSKSAYWVGYTDIENEGRWTLIGGAFTFTSWGTDEPNNFWGVEDYAAIFKSNGKWNDFPGFANGYTSMGFICKTKVKVEPTSIKLNNSTLTLEVGKTETLTVTVSPSNAYDKSITWTSSNTNTATVSNGTITAKSAGTAMITAKTINGKTATCTVTVKSVDVAVTGISLSKSSMVLEVGKSEDLIAEVIPTNATNKAITWTSSNSAVATVSNGKVVAKSVGETTITAKTANGKTATCKVVVKDNVDPNAPQVIVESRTINAGKEFTVNIELKNNPGINGWAFDIDYDSDVIELIKCDEGVFNEITTSEKQNANPYHIQWFGLKDDTSNGVIAKLTFKAKENAEEGDYPIKVTYDEYEIGNEKDEQVHFDVVNGIIKVTKHLPGDVNGDGRVNLRDVIRLNQYVAGWNVTVVDNSTDINGDGRVNLRDVIRLNQYVAGWKVDIY